MTRPLAQLRVLSMAHAVALQAKCGVLRRDQVAALDDAMAVLPQDDPARATMADFIAGVRQHGRQPDQLIAAGTDLQQAVRRALWPVPDGRSDLHG